LRESAFDDIANAMSSLAASSKAPVRARTALPLQVVGQGAGATSVATAVATAADPSCAEIAKEGTGPIYLAPADEVKCNDCGTCYQELPQFFEKKTMIIDGESQTVATMVPGALDTVQLTPELQKRMDRVKSSCDAEIIK
jgi:pyruvate-ferredoxin/flavodoxin oxidoreductase